MVKQSPDPQIEDDAVQVPSQPWLVYISIVLGIVMVFGLVTWALGLGPFAYRQIFYGTSEVYILNLGDVPVTVQLDQGNPIEVGPESAERTPILGGTTTLITRDKDGKILEEKEVFVDGAPVVYNVMGHRCLVLSDVSSYYLGSPSPGVEVTSRHPKGTRIIPLPHERVIWPRETLRDQVTGAKDGVAWLEIVGCSLLDDSEEHLLAGHLNSLLTERKRAEKEREAAEKIRREMLRGGGDAVDKAMGIDRSPTKKKGGATMKITPPPGAEGAKPKDDAAPGADPAAAPAAAPEKK